MAFYTNKLTPIIRMSCTNNYFVTLTKIKKGVFFYSIKI